MYASSSPVYACSFATIARRVAASSVSPRISASAYGPSANARTSSMKRARSGGLPATLWWYHATAASVGRKLT